MYKQAQRFLLKQKSESEQMMMTRGEYYKRAGQFNKLFRRRRIYRLILSIHSATNPFRILLRGFLLPQIWDRHWPFGQDGDWEVFAYAV